MHLTRSPCSLQTSKDTQADPNETQDPDARRKKDRNPVVVQEILGEGHA